MSGYYDLAPVLGYFHVQFRHADGTETQQCMHATSHTDLATKAQQYADQHGLVVEGAVGYGGHPVPGIGGAREVSR